MQVPFHHVEAELNMHMKRASFVAQMWVNADVPQIQQHPTDSYGWDFDNGYYWPIWHEGPQMPDTLIPEDEVSGDESIKEEDMTVDCLI